MTLGRHHPALRRLARLCRSHAARSEERAFVLEGPHVVAEALAAGAPLEAVYVAGPHPVAEQAAAAGVPVYGLAPGVLARVTATVTPQPVVAVGAFVDVPLDRLRGAGLVVVCVEVRDPGNLGTLLRTAEAAGAGGLVCTRGTVDVYNPKCVRASAGALFHVPVVVGADAKEVLGEMGRWGVRRLGAVAHGGTPYTAADLTGAVAIVLGNEARGLPTELDVFLDGKVSIPMAGRAESLNVGIAAAVLCFEAARQRAGKAHG
jgi:TrmH family RNA methyltransferase